MMPHLSLSDEQSQIEAVLREQLQSKFGLKKETKTIGDAKVEFDLFSEETRTIGEIYSHIGKLKSGSIRKVLSDILKIEMYAQYRGGNWNKYIYLCDREARESFLGNSWRNEAVKLFGFKVENFEITLEQRMVLEQAQKRQMR